MGADGCSALPSTLYPLSSTLCSHAGTLQAMPLAAIISNPQKPELCEVLAELTEWFGARGYTYLLDPESAAYLERREEAVERSGMAAHAPELCVTLGGDGTLL